MRTKQNLIQDTSSEKTHHPFIPQDIRDNDPVEATLIVDSVEYRLKVWKISPFGIELACSDKIDLTEKNKYEVIIRVGNESSELKGIFVFKYNSGENTIACIRFTSDLEPFNNIERRGSHRWSCSSQFYPTGIANSPAKYNDFIYFRIKDISYGGMKLVCSLRNKFLFPQMSLNAMINFPMLSQVNIKLKIVNLGIINEDGKEEICLGATYDTSDTKLNQVICNYLLQFSNAKSFKDLKEVGFSTDKLSSSIDFTYVKNKQDYDDCLRLRHLANKSASKIKNILEPDDMADEFDTRSRIVLGRHKGQVVCTVRLAFHEIEDNLEIEKYTELPEDFPRRDQTIEVMRLCTHPDFRGSDMLMALFKHLAIIVVQSGRKHIVTSCVEGLKPLYNKIGFQTSGIVYQNPLFKEHPDHVMVANLETLILGKGINPIIWNIVWGDLFDYFENYEIVDYTPLDKLRVKMVKLLNPISRHISSKELRKKKI